MSQGDAPLGDNRSRIPGRSLAPATQELIFNPFDPSFREDPYPVYDQLLAGERVRETPAGIWIFSRYEDCNAVLRDPRFSADSRNAAGYEEVAAGRAARALDENRPFLFLDPPDHRRLRGLVSKAFTASAVEQMRPRVEELVEGCLETADERGEMDVIADLAYPLPVIVISEMLGVPAEDQARFKEWSDELARALDPEFAVSDQMLARREAAADAFREYFSVLIEERRRSPREDLLSALVAAEEEGERLTHAELLTTCILLLVAGHETTVNLIANGLLALMRHPKQVERLLAEPALIDTAVEELLRFDPPVQFTGRIALEDVEIAGVTVPAGKIALTLLAAANRDPQQFSSPSKLDIGRDPNPHLSFGMGIHRCLGAPLARLEGKVAIEAAMRRFPSMQVAVDRLEYKENVVLRGLAALPVRL